MSTTKINPYIRSSRSCCRFWAITPKTAGVARAWSPGCTWRGQKVLICSNYQAVSTSLPGLHFRSRPLTSCSFRWFPKSNRTDKHTCIAMSYVSFPLSEYQMCKTIFWKHKRSWHYPASAFSCFNPLGCVEIYSRKLFFEPEDFHPNQWIHPPPRQSLCLRASFVNRLAACEMTFVQLVPCFMAAIWLHIQLIEFGMPVTRLRGVDRLSGLQWGRSQMSLTVHVTGESSSYYMGR